MKQRDLILFLISDAKACHAVCADAELHTHTLCGHFIGQFDFVCSLRFVTENDQNEW